jgi:hypothetical protein
VRCEASQHLVQCTERLALDRSIQTGTECCYRPVERLTWHLSASESAPR